MSYNKQIFPLLPKNHCFPKLDTTRIHSASHLGVIATALKLRLHYWIVEVNDAVAYWEVKILTKKAVLKS